MHAYALVPALTTAIIGVMNGMFFSEERCCWFGDVCKSLGNCPDGNIWGKGYWVVIISVTYSCVNVAIITPMIAVVSAGTRA